MKSFVAGKASILSITAVIAVVSILFGNTLANASKVFATPSGSGSATPTFAITSISANCDGTGQVTYTGTIPTGGFTLELMDKSGDNSGPFIPTVPATIITITSGTSPVSYVMPLTNWNPPHYRVDSNFETKSPSLNCQAPTTLSCTGISATPALAGNKFTLGETYTFTPTITGSPTSYAWSILPTLPALTPPTNTSTVLWTAPSIPNPGTYWTISLNISDNSENASSCSLRVSDPSGTTQSSPTPTPSSTPLACSEDQHLDATGKNCVSYQLGGPSGSGGNSGGQVLGASTMAGTGTFEENLYLAIMTLGGTLSAFGIRSFKKARKTA